MTRSEDYIIVRGTLQGSLTGRHGYCTVFVLGNCGGHLSQRIIFSQSRATCGASMFENVLCQDAGCSSRPSTRSGNGVVADLIRYPPLLVRSSINLVRGYFEAGHSWLQRDSWMLCLNAGRPECCISRFSSFYHHQAAQYAARVSCFCNGRDQDPDPEPAYGWSTNTNHHW